MIQQQVKIGILGGMSTVATGEYYKLINEQVREIHGGYASAEMIISSVNFAYIEKFVRNNEWAEAGVYLVEKAKALQDAGAECIFLATNTMHKVRDAIKHAIDVPFVDIFETVSKEISQQGFDTVGILGTYPVMSEAFYEEAYGEFGIRLVSPDEADKRVIDQIIFEELTNNEFKPASKTQFLNVMRRLQHKGSQGIILGCTEIKLLVNQQDIEDIPLFDTTTLHCDLAANICTGKVKI